MGNTCGLPLVHRQLLFTMASFHPARLNQLLRQVSCVLVFL